MNDINKPFYKNLQDIDGNKAVKFDVCKCSWSGDKTHFEKTAFKDMDWNWYLQMQIDKVQYNKHLNVYFGCFLFTSLKEDML